MEEIQTVTVLLIIGYILIGVSIMTMLNLDWISHLIMYRDTENKKGYISLKTLLRSIQQSEWDTDKYSKLNRFTFTHFPKVSSLFKNDSNITVSKLHANLIKFKGKYHWTDPITYYIVIWYLFFNNKKLNRKKEK